MSSRVPVKACVSNRPQTPRCNQVSVDAATMNNDDDDAPTTVLQVQFDSPAAPPSTTSISFDDLPPTNATLRVAANGTGEASMALSMRYVPARMPDSPMYRGISVQRVIQAINASDASATGLPLQRVPLASRLRVTVQIMTPDSLSGAVVVRVPMPGGLEALDSNVLTSVPRSAAESAALATDPGCPMSGLVTAATTRAAPWWLPPCPQLFVMPQAVELRFSSLPAGTFEASFLAVAGSMGEWALPPASAYVLAEPELGGLSSGGALTVCERDCDVQVADAGVMQGCPGDCSGAGWCDVRRGVCLCLQGFSGVGCEEVVAA